MKKFVIYHAMGEEAKAQVFLQREKVYEVFAESLDAAFIASQRKFNEDYALLDIRDTRVGDIIQDVETGACYMILEKGYQSVAKNTLQYIDWGIELNKIICVKQLSLVTEGGRP